MVDGGLLDGRYKLGDLVASGGMGTVYRATDERLGRSVAVKILKENLVGDPQFVERFRREARAVASLSHPNIANIYDYGQDDERHYIVMEFVEGRDLSDVLTQEGRLPAERAAAIASQICAAVDHAHAAGIIHRDIKPANVILDSHDRVKVTDFGIARTVGDSTMTGTGLVMGTAKYLSPEQAMGTKVVPTSDIYSIGIVLYEMLTGEVPFVGDSAVSVALQHAKDDTPVPSSVAPEVSDELDAVVARATAKEPGERWPTGAAMAGALAGALGGAAVDATEPHGHRRHHRSPWDRLADPRRQVGPRESGQEGSAGVRGPSRPGTRPPRVQGSSRRSATSPPSNPSRRRTTPEPVVEETEDTPTPTPEGFVIPDEIIGADAKEVEDFLKDAGFKVKKEDVETSEVAEDTVVDTDPGPGSTVQPGDEITLYVAKEPKGHDKEGDDD